MSEDTVKVTISYGGKEKRIPLAVRPALELSDEQVAFAETDFMAIVRRVFQVPPDNRAELYETEGGRIMTRESFRDPSYLPNFPRHWYLTTEAPLPPPISLPPTEILDEKVRMAESGNVNILQPVSYRDHLGNCL